MCRFQTQAVGLVNVALGLGLAWLASCSPNYSDYSSDGQGWCDSRGVWHAGPAASGYRDSEGVWRHNMQTSGAWRDERGNWRTDANPAGGWWDSQGRWHENANAVPSGWRDDEGKWHEGASER